MPPLVDARECDAGGLAAAPSTVEGLRHAWTQGHMRATFVGVWQPRLYETPQMVLGEQNHEVYALPAQCAQQALAKRLALGTPGWGFEDFQPQVAYPLVEILGEDRIEEGIAQIRQELIAYRGLGMAMEDPYFLALLAEAHASVDRTEEAHTALAEALVALPSGRDFFYKAELYRLQGELLRQWSESDDGQVEAYFQQALEVARRQQAKSLELRAAMSLSLFWQHQGRRGGARQLLTDIYGWFTEGLDTIDLQEARKLIDDLAR